MNKYFTTPPQSSTKATFKIVILYFIISLLWIFFSDTLLGKLNLSLSAQTTVSIIKGWGFVIVTSILLYYLIKKSTDYIFDDYNMISKIMETVPVGITFVSKEGQIIFTNKNAEKILGVKKEQITSRTYNDPEWKITSLDGSPLPTEQLPFFIVQRTGDAVNNAEHAIEYISGRRTLLSINAAPIKDKNNNFDGMISVIEDITERKQAEEEILKLNRVYAVISQINQAIVHLREKDKLLSEVCRVAIEFGKFHMAWIGLVDEERRLVNPVSFAGNEDGYLSKIKKISIGDVAEGRGPTGTAIREGKHIVCDDIENDPCMVPWKDEALDRGYRSSIALPIKLFGKVTGAFSLYASVPHFFDQKEIDLLDEVAGDISFALEAIEVGEKQKETEQTLIDREKRYRELFMNHPHPMWIYEVDTLNIIEVNESAISNYGYSKDEFTSLTLKDIRPEEDVPLLLNNVKTHDESTQRNRTFRHKKKDGSIIQVDISSHNLPSLNNTKYRIVMAIDITEQFKAEEALHESEERFRTAFEHSASGMCLTAPNGNFLQVNKAFCKMLGYSADELLNLTFEKITHPDDISLSKSFADKAVEEQTEMLHFEKRYLRKDGNVIWTEVSSSLLRDAKKNPLYFITQIIDITERKRAEEEIKTKTEDLQTLINIIFKITEVTDLSTRLEYIMDEALNIVGLEGGTICLINPDETFDLAVHRGTSQETIDDLSEHKIKIGECLCGNCAKECKPLILNTREGILEFATREVLRGEDIRFHAAFPFVTQEKCVGVLCVFTRTDNKPTERSLKFLETIVAQTSVSIENASLYDGLHESEIKFRNVFENSVDAIGVSKSGIHVFVNPAYLTLFGYANSNELTGKPIIDLIAPSEHTKILDNVKRREIGELSLSCYETRGLRKDGSEFDMDVHVSIYELNNETYTLVILRDITERKHAEEMLHRNEEVLRLFVEHSPASIAMFDREMKYIVASHRFLIDYDLGEQNVVGRSHYEIFPEIPERWKEIHKRCLAGATEKCDEDLFPRASGKVDWVRWEIRPWFELNNKIGGIILFSEIITEYKHAEEEIKKSREELRSLSNHLQTIREEERTYLAREMHDEVGQILTSIKMNLSLMKRQVEDKEKKLQTKELDEEIQSMSKMVDHAVVRVRKMITELRPELLDKLGLIPALEWYVEEYEKETKIKSEFKCDFEELSLDHNVELTIFRIIQEALTNVLKHASAKHVSIDVKKMRDHILVEVFDDGKGITEEEMKEKKSFGLLGMRERANLVGGKLEISGIAGKGTTVRLVIHI